MSKILGWAAFGVAVRWWQLGIEMRPMFAKETLIHYPLYGAITGSFGYWLMGVEQRQTKYLDDRREALLEKRRRYQSVGGNGGNGGGNEASVPVV